MNIPAERLKTTATLRVRDLVNHPFIRKNYTKLERIANRDRSLDALVSGNASILPLPKGTPHIEALMRYFHFMLIADEEFGGKKGDDYFLYVEWILILYMKQKIQASDIPDVMELLYEYDELHKNDELLDEDKDINKVNSIQELKMLLKKYHNRARPYTI